MNYLKKVRHRPPLVQCTCPLLPANKEWGRELQVRFVAQMPGELHATLTRTACHTRPHCSLKRGDQSVARTCKHTRRQAARPLGRVERSRKQKVHTAPHVVHTCTHAPAPVLQTRSRCTTGATPSDCTGGSPLTSELLAPSELEKGEIGGEGERSSRHP